MLSRRQFLWLSVTASAGVAAAACSSKTSSTPPRGGAGSDGEDIASRFARFEPADEPNGDLSKVVWPAFVIEGGPEVQELYAFQVTHGELMRYMPCFCGCGRDAGHRNNRDCYVQSVGSDGSVVFDSMAPT